VIRSLKETARTRDGFELIRIQGASAELRLHSCMKGSVRVGEQMQTLDELQKQGKSVLTLSGSDIGKIRVGTVNFFLMFVPRPPAIPKSPLLTQDRLFWTVQASVLVLTALVMAIYPQCKSSALIVKMRLTNRSSSPQPDKIPVEIMQHKTVHCPNFTLSKLKRV
jgi:hypothetical protein